MSHTSARPALHVAALVVWATLAAGPSPHAAGPLAPVNLRSEYQVNPIGLDEKTPRFSWEVNDPRRGAGQSAYRVLASTQPAELDKDIGSAWDTGKVDSDQSIHVAYAGKPVESCTRYYWKVRTWDAAGQASPWSAVAFWETGVLDPKEWSARWITIADPPATSQRARRDTGVDPGLHGRHRDGRDGPAASAAG